jgi:hypothetical protein
MATRIQILVLIAITQIIYGCVDQDRSTTNKLFVVESQSVEAANESFTSISAHENSSLFNANTSNDLEEVEDGEFDCRVTNITRNEGPYTLKCEKDSDEITIHFPNGGYIVTNIDGLHESTGEFWAIEEN